MKWEVGQTVMVQSRTWANINKSGGCAKITKVHTSSTDDGSNSYIEGLDVKYVVDGRCEKNLDPAIVSPYEHLERGGRKRRSRDFLMKRAEDAMAEQQKQNRNSLGRKNACTNTNRNSNSTKKATSGSHNAPPAAAEAAGKENRSSLQSSATCSTPEKPKPIKRPKRVTPIPKIPKMVITGKRIDDVSPLIEDISSSSLHTTGTRRPHPYSSNKKKTVAVARGLIFDSIEKEKSRPAKATTTESKTIPTGGARASLLTSNLNNPRLRVPVPHSTAKQQIGKITSSRPLPNSFALMDKKPAASSTLNLNRPRKNPPPLAAAKAKSSTTTKTAKKPRPRYKLAATTKPTAPASFSRVTSAYDKKRRTSSLSETNKKPLLDVYRAEVQKARDFMDEMVGHRSDSDLAAGLAAASAPSEKTSFFSTKSRYDQFLSHLYKVWTKIDEEEVSEESFRQVFNQITSNSFTAQELDSHIQTMCDEGKEVMKSDGMLYRIH
mmetsp:Transcript_27411/g.57454  ORF Transcript_27411/g.57454 Transcript_27411/m.57454 type:complete len:492 (-) Transcript_27411:940-2415(-)